MGRIIALENSYIEILTSAQLQNMTIFGNKVNTVVILSCFPPHTHTLNLSSLVWSIMQYDWFSYKKGAIWTQAHVETHDVKRHEEKMAVCKPRRGPRNRPFFIALKRNKLCWLLDVRLLTSRPVRPSACVVSATACVFLFVSSEKQIQMITIQVLLQRPEIKIPLWYLGTWTFAQSH